MCAGQQHVRQVVGWSASPSGPLHLRAGLVVHRVLGLRNLAELRPADAPSGAPAWYGLRWTDAQGGLWQEIDLSLLAQDPGFLQVGL